MKTAFCTNVFPLEEHSYLCERLAQIGFDGVELWPQYLESRPLCEVQKQVTDFELKVAQICPYFNLTGSEAQLEETFRIARRYIDYAKQLDCPNIRVFTGTVSVREASARVYAQAVAGLQTICDMEKDRCFVLETHKGSLMETPETTLRLLHAVGRDNLRVNLQVPMELSDHDPYECAEMLGEYTVHLHSHNWIGQENNLTFLSDGDYDYEKFVGILYRKGFDGYLSIEHADHFGKHSPLETAAHEAAYLKELIARIEG